MFRNLISSHCELHKGPLLDPNSYLGSKRLARAGLVEKAQVLMYRCKITDTCFSNGPLSTVNLHPYETLGHLRIGLPA